MDFERIGEDPYQGRPGGVVYPDAPSPERFPEHVEPHALALDGDLRVVVRMDSVKSALLVESDAPSLEEAGEVSLQRQVLGRAARDSRLAVHQPDTVGNFQRQIEVVRREEDGFVGCLHQPVEELHDFDFARVIQKGGGLVEEDYRCLLRQRFGNHHFLAFPVRERVNHAVRQLLDTDETQGVGYFPPVFVGQPSPEAGIGAPSHADQIFDAHVPDFALFGQYDADEPAQLPV